MANVHYEVAVLTKHSRAPSTNLPSDNWGVSQQVNVTFSPDVPPPVWTQEDCLHLPGTTPTFVCPKVQQTAGDLNFAPIYDSQTENVNQSSNNFGSVEVAPYLSDFHSSSGHFSSSDPGSSALSSCPFWTPAGTQSNVLLADGNGLQSHPVTCVEFSDSKVEVDSTDGHPSQYGNTFLLEANLKRVASEIFEFDRQLGQQSVDDEKVSDVFLDASNESGSSISYKSAKSCLSQDDKTATQGNWIWAGRSESQSDISVGDDRSSVVDSEDNFADVESSDKLYSSVVKGVKHFKKPSKLRQFTKLETIHSPSCQAVVKENCVKPVGPSSTTDGGLGSDAQVGSTNSSNGNKDAEMVVNNVYQDSGAETADFVEMSSLNPNCQPFVPRAHRREVNDSGYPNTSHMANTTLFGDSVSESLNRASLSEQEEKLQPTQFSTISHQPFRISFERCPNPYRCPVNHREDFIPVQSFVSSDLPTGFRHDSILESILSISQRVVKLEVCRYQDTKSFTLVNELCSSQSTITSTNRNLEDRSDHLGTGFAQFIDKERIEIRTHLAVLSKAEDAGNSKITFNLLLPSRQHAPLEVACFGEKEGFKLNKYTQSCTLVCKTPTSMLPYLHLFQNTPVNSQTSIFNDSCYYSDSNPSPNTTSEFEDIKVYQNVQPKVRNQEESTFQKEQASDSRAHKRGTSSGFDSIWTVDSATEDKLLSDDNELPLWATEDVSDGQDFQIPCESLPSVLEDRFNFLSINEEAVYRAFSTRSESDSNHCLKPVSKPPSTRKEIPVDTGFTYSIEDEMSLLEIVEKRMEQKQKQPYKGRDLFGGVGAYNLFSSYAGDEISKWSPFPPQDGAVSGVHIRQEYEGLLYTQNNHREEYDRVRRFHDSSRRTDTTSAGGLLPKPNKDHVNSAPIDDTDCADVQHSGSNTDAAVDNDFSMHSPASTSRHYQATPDNSDTWDKDLLNLDDNLQPLGDYDLFENLVNDILTEEESNSISASRNLSNKGKYSVIISHPHGGPKSVSIGRFSRHNHVGGDLYDTPTCMGSCGAPIVALGSLKGGAYVTPLMHAGTDIIQGLPTGLGTTSCLGDTNWAQTQVVQADLDLN